MGKEQLDTNSEEYKKLLYSAPKEFWDIYKRRFGYDKSWILKTLEGENFNASNVRALISVVSRHITDPGTPTDDYLVLREFMDEAEKTMRSTF